MALKDKKIIVLVEQDYQELEVWYPVLRLREEHVQVTLVGTGSAPEYRGKHGYPARVDSAIQDVRADEHDGVIVPGGWAPDRLRRHREVLDLVARMDRQGKLVASICHGPWVLASAGVAMGRKLTAYASIRDDMKNAGAKFVDEPVVRDRNLITSRVPDDLPDFCREILAFLREEE